GRCYARPWHCAARWLSGPKPVVPILLPRAYGPRARPWADIGLLLRSGNSVHTRRLQQLNGGQVVVMLGPGIALLDGSPARRASAMSGQGIALDDRRPRPKSSTQAPPGR